MHPVAFRIYNLLPHSLKEFAASLYAKKLQQFRRNNTSDARIREAALREKWTFEQWETYHENELENVLKRAAYHVPYYRNYWQKKGYENGAWKKLENWPILTKKEVREHNHELLADDCDPKDMYTEYTSGTSGTPLTVYWSKETTLEYYAIFERRIRNWHDANWDMNYLMLGGRMIIPVSQQKPPFWVKNNYMNQLYLSSYHLSAQNIGAYAEAIKKFKPEYMFAYASSMYSLSLLAKESGIKMPALKCAISNAEPLLAHQVETIREVFSCKMVNTYGMSELAAGACTFDNENELVLWPEVSKIEVLNFDNDNSVNEGENGRFICTTLLNKDMPLIRYEIGDSGAITRSRSGINHYKITELTGRIDDLVKTRDGRRIGRLDPVFKNNLNIKEAQIIQKSAENFTIKIVPDINYNPSNAEAMVESLKQRIGDCIVTIEVVDSIPRTNTGKFKAVISEVS